MFTVKFDAILRDSWFSIASSEMVVESWFRNLWRTSQKHEIVTEDPVIGVLAFEVASLMSKLVHLWHCLADKQVKKLREAVSDSIGIKKLISEDEDYIVRLISAEMMDNLGNVSGAVARLGKKCSNPNLNNLEQVFDDLIKFGVDVYGLHFTWKKMEQTVKKMQKLISINSNLHQEWETLAELEQTLRRMRSFPESDSKIMLEYQKRIAWKRHEVKSLQEKSLWKKTCVDMVMLMTRSIFTIFCRIKHVFGLGQHEDTMELKDSKLFHSNDIHRCQSVSSALLQSAVHPSQSSIPRFSSGPLGKKLTMESGPLSNTNETYNSFSGPIRSTSSKSGSNHRANKALNSYSGQIVKTSLTNSGPTSKRSIFGLKLWHYRNNSSTLDEKLSLFKPTLLAASGSLTGQLSSANSVDKNLLDPPSETLGAAALALHYANVILVIEKLVSSPHLISHDARDDLYNMLPSTIRASIRMRLKPFNKALDSSVCDTALAREWSEAMTRILEWLSPLAHSTVRWQSDRSYEQQCLTNGANVVLVQTLHFVNQEKAEAIITELLVGLNYVWRFGRDISADTYVECSSMTKFCDYLYEAP